MIQVDRQSSQFCWFCLDFDNSQFSNYFSYFLNHFLFLFSIVDGGKLLTFGWGLYGQVRYESCDHWSMPVI